jgi:adenylate cyclase
MDLARLLGELRRRGVYRASAAYVIAAFALLQGADIVLPALGFSPAVMTGVVVLAILGLPAAATLAWIFDLTPQGLERTEPPAPGAGPAVTRGAAVAGVLGVALVGLVVAIAAWAGVRAASRAAAPAGGGGASAGASVAVLPCNDVTAAPEGMYYGDGMTEEIIGELARFEGLKVISRTSVMALRESALTMPQIADTLGVRHVLECSVQRSGERIRVRATLFDPHADRQVWTEAYDRDIGDVVRMQEEIARQVGTALLHRIPDIARRADEMHLPPPAAYDAYLRGAAARRQLSRASLIEAAAAFEEAIAADPSYAPSWSGLAQVEVSWTQFGYIGGADPYERVALAMALAQRAVELDSTLAAAYWARAQAGLRASLPQDVILRDAERAVALAPNSAEMRLLRGAALAFAGRFEDAVIETAAAISLDPLAPGHHDFRALTLLLARRYEEALRSARTARSLAPAFLNPIRQELRALLLLGRFDECLAIDPGPYVMLRAACLHSAGRTDEARALVHDLARALEGTGSGNELLLNPGGVAGDIAEYHAWLGDVDGTLRWLRRSVDFSPTAQFLVHHTGTYDRVRDQPAFETGMARIRDELHRRSRAATPAPLPGTGAPAALDSPL